MEHPVSETPFVESRAWERLKLRANESSSPVIFLTGPPGNGKTTLAVQSCCVKVVNDLRADDKNYLYRMLNSTTIADFCRDLEAFYDDVMDDKKLRKNIKEWDILQNLFHDVSEKFPDRLKLFILENVHVTDTFLKQLNTIANNIMERGEGTKWKIFVTSQEDIPETKQQHYKVIDKANFIHVEEFNMQETEELFKSFNLDSATVQLIGETLGWRPLALKIWLQTLEDFPDTEPVITQKKLLDSIQQQAKTEKSKDKSILLAIKACLELGLGRLPSDFQESAKQVVKTLALFHEMNIPSVLVVACAERYQEDPKDAADMNEKLDLFHPKKSFGTSRDKDGVKLYHLHKLVRESMMLFVKEEDDKKPLIRQALIALTTVMNKDDRHHNRLAGIYIGHGEALVKAIDVLLPEVNRDDTPFVMFLQSIMLLESGYCWQTAFPNPNKGLDMLKKSRDTFCLLLTGSNYETVCAGRNREEIVKELYQKTKDLSMLTETHYIKYAQEVPYYQRLTPKDLKNMLGSDGETELLNGHLDSSQLKKLKREQKVVEPERMPHIVVAEFMASMYGHFSYIVYSAHENDLEDTKKYLRSAVEVCNYIYQDYEVYLLASLISERELVTRELETATVEDVKGLIQRTTALAAKDGYAFEGGLRKSHLPDDNYNKLLCKQMQIKCRGRLYKLTGKSEYFTQGSNLFEEVKKMASDEYNSDNALCHSYLIYAGFLDDCNKYVDAVTFTLKAMSLLCKHLRTNTKEPNSHPELQHPTFRTLYKDISNYYQKYTRTEDDVTRWDVHSPEVKYLRDVVDAWSEEGLENNQFTESSVEFSELRTIADKIHSMTEVAPEQEPEITPTVADDVTEVPRGAHPR